jgi:hypothetical protein
VVALRISEIPLPGATVVAQVLPVDIETLIQNVRCWPDASDA